MASSIESLLLDLCILEHTARRYLIKLPNNIEKNAKLGHFC